MFQATPKKAIAICSSYMLVYSRYKISTMCSTRSKWTIFSQVPHLHHLLPHFISAQYLFCTMATSAPTNKPIILIVTGAWHIPEHYTRLIAELKNRGFTVLCPHLISNSYDGAGGRWDITVQQDAALIRAIVTPFIELGRNIVLVGHSYGGLVISQASEGLSAKQRKEKGLEGGITRLIYMCAFMVDVGMSLADAIGEFYPPPWMDVHVSHCLLVLAHSYHGLNCSSQYCRRTVASPQTEWLKNATQGCPKAR
jgi:pimeloyl-ACP methyl ester carboxylesterase